MITVGYATLQIIPSMRGFSSALSRGVAPSMGNVGKTAGTALGSEMSRSATSSFTRGLGGIAATIGAVAVGGLIKSAVTLEATYSSTMRQIGVAAEAPRSQLAAMDKLAMQLGQDTTFSANEAAGAMLELAKNGITPATIQAGALKSALLLAAAGGIDLSAAATTMGNSLGAFGLKGSQSAEVANALAGAANASSASVDSLAQGLSQASAVAADVGFSIQETTAAMAAFAHAGIAGSDAGTSLKTFLSRLVPVTEATQKGFTALNLGFTKSNGEFKSLSAISEELTDKFGNMSAAERSVAFNSLFGSDARRAATVLMNEGAKGIEKYIEATSDQTQAQKLADATMKGTSGAIERLSGAFDTAKLQLGKGLAPVIQTVADGLAGMLSSGDITKNVQDFTGYIGDLLDNLKPLGETAFPVAVDVAEGFGDVLGVTAGFLKDVTGFVGDLPEPVQKFGTQLAFAAVGLVALNKALVFTKSTALVGFAGQLLDVETRTEALGRAAKTAAGAGGLLALAAGASESNDALSTLELSAGGALLGFQVGGPIGAAIGGGIGLLGGLGKAILGAGDDADAAKPQIGALADTFNALTGAITRSTRAGIAKSLGEIGVLADAASIGVSGSTIVDAVMGKPGAIDDASAAMDAFVQRAQGNLTQAQATFNRLLDASLAGPLTAQDQMILNAARDSIPLYQSALDDAKSAVDGLSDSIGVNRDELSGQVAAQRLVLEANRGSVVSVRDLKAALTGLPKEAVTAVKALDVDTTRADVKALGEQFDLTPKRVSTLIEILGFEKAQEKTKKSIEELARLNNTTARPKIVIDTGPAVSAIQSVLDMLNGFGGAPSPNGLATRTTGATRGHGPSPTHPAGVAPSRASVDGGVHIDKIDIVAHDYGDFLQQTQRRARARASSER